ncbi:MAG: ATP-grasp domain-containing protein [Paludibacteraceae bacterium]
MINKVVILGGFVNALGAARQAGRLGVNVQVVTKRSSNLACYSRYVKHCFYYSSEDELAEILKRIAKEGTMLYPTSDEDVEFIDTNREWLRKMYQFVIPDSDTIRLFAAKTNSYQFAERNGIPYPHSFYLDEEGKIADAVKMTYPVVFKPSVMYDFREKFGKKAYICANEKRLQEKCDFIKRSGYPLDKMIAQEFMSGGPACLFSVGLFAVNGEIRKQIQVNRLRQRPMILGNSTTYCVTSNIEQLYEYAEKIVRLTNYSGVAEVEFMLHNGEYKFLEVNMRSWKWHSISDAYGFSFIGECVKYLNGEAAGEKTPRKNAAWVDRVTDWMVSVPEIIHGRMGLGAFVKSYCRKKEHAIWSWSDMLPAFVYPIQLARNLFRKIN